MEELQELEEQWTLLPENISVGQQNLKEFEKEKAENKLWHKVGTIMEPLVTLTLAIHCFKYSFHKKMYSMPSYTDHMLPADFEMLLVFWALSLLQGVLVYPLKLQICSQVAATANDESVRKLFKLVAGLEERRERRSVSRWGYLLMLGGIGGHIGITLYNLFESSGWGWRPRSRDFFEGEEFEKGTELVRLLKQILLGLGYILCCSFPLRAFQNMLFWTSKEKAFEDYLEELEIWESDEMKAWEDEEEMDIEDELRYFRSRRDNVENKIRLQRGYWQLKLIGVGVSVVSWGILEQMYKLEGKDVVGEGEQGWPISYAVLVCYMGLIWEFSRKI